MPTMRLGALPKRAPSSSDGDSKQKVVIILVSIAAAVLFGILIYYLLRQLRVSKYSEPGGPKRRSLLHRLRLKLSARDGARTPLSTVEVENIPQDPEANVNRHTSIRSIVTLPAYSAIPHDGEGVIAREGDRAGMDTVVEFPETAEEEEGRREEEMASLWRIRQQRRHEASEREDRRRRRREARARGDSATLNAIRHESRLRATYQQNNRSDLMIAEHNSRPRERRVSAVSYGDLGVARHDGSRVRANSAGSDNTPLLEGAEGMADMAGMRPWLSRETISTHHRMHSSSSILSTSSFDSNDRTGFDRGEGVESELISLQQTRSRAHSRSQQDSLSLRRSSTQIPLTDMDVGDNSIPLPDPPHYDSMGFEEAPPYEDIALEPAPQSPAEEAETFSTPPQLPTIERLPSIRITDASPIEPPHTPVVGGTNITTPPTIHEETN